MDFLLRSGGKKRGTRMGLNTNYGCKRGTTLSMGSHVMTPFLIFKNKASLTAWELTGESLLFSVPLHVHSQVASGQKFLFASIPFTRKGHYSLMNQIMIP
jgi:hypothetical protein